jgi:hypothetical protein
MKSFVTPMFASILCLTGALVWAQDIREERVQFPRGGTGTTIEDSITGYEIVDYKLGARAGQFMSVTLNTDNGANYFNVMAPGETEVAFFIGSTEGYEFSAQLPETGDYTIRVYQMRSAARRDETANYRLELSISALDRVAAENHTATTDKSSAQRAGEGDFDATGQIPCAQYSGQPMGQCDFGVAREGGGTATVVVTRPDGMTRALFFIDGEFNSADTSQADGYPEYGATREADLNMIRVGAERYEVPDAVIFGG